MSSILTRSASKAKTIANGLASTTTTTTTKTSTKITTKSKSNKKNIESSDSESDYESSSSENEVISSDSELLSDIDEDPQQHQASSDYAKKLRAHFIKHKNPTVSDIMCRYMRSQFPFIGLKAPQRHELLASFLEKNGRPSESEILDIYRLPEREFKYVSMDLAAHQLPKNNDKNRINLYIAYAKHEPWWDTIDIIASKFIGGHFKKFPDMTLDYTDKWIIHSSMWFRRISLIFQLTYKQQADQELLFKYIRMTFHEKEFFIRKAIGWALREHAKLYPKDVKGFINEHEDQLSKLSIVEALRHLNKKKENK
eukprot:gene2482-3070_t